MALHRGTKIAEIAQVPQIPKIAQIAEIWLVSIVPNLVKTDQLIREGCGVLIAGSARRHTG